MISGIKETAKDHFLLLNNIGESKKMLPTGLKLYGCGIILDIHTNTKTKLK